MKGLHYISFLMALTVATGCSTTREEPTVPAEVCELTITLRAETSEAGSRADQPWGEPYPEEAGLPDERRIDQVALYLITPDNYYISLTPTQMYNSEGAYHYKTTVNLNDQNFVTKQPDGRYTMSGRIVAMANYPSRAFVADPFEAPFNMTGALSTGTIPMWGVASFTNKELRVNSTIELGEVKMLRSLSKITIMMDDDFKALYKITKVEPLQGGYGRWGNCEPTGCLTAASTGELMLEGCFNPVTADQVEADLKFYGTGSEKVYCYTVERRCDDQGVFPLSMNVTVERKDGSEPPFTGQIYLCDYANGQPVADTGFKELVRNHDYQFKLKLAPLDFKVSFKEWIMGGKVHLELE